MGVGGEGKYDVSSGGLFCFWFLVGKDHEVLVQKHEAISRQLAEQEQQVSQQKQKYEELQVRL